MDLLSARLFFYFFIYFTCFISLNYGSEEIDLTTEPGHLKPFGTGRPIHDIEEVQGFPSPDDFFKNYFFPQKPVKIASGAKMSPAFKLWTDEYFLNLNIPEHSTVFLETVKKESRQQKTMNMAFKKFVKTYMNSTYYMVDNVPEYLKSDLIVPCSLQCQSILAGKLDDILMWFSSGGTNSVVHHDGFDNINCVYRGSKDFIIVDPVKFKNMVPIDRPEGAYSTIDVDKMDYTKYPTLAKIEYIHAHMEPGDCLYIPYKWIHQVRSYNSNLAVNIWWNHYSALDVDTSQCNKKCDPNMTLHGVKTKSSNRLPTSGEPLRAYIMDELNLVPNKMVPYDEFILELIPVIVQAEGDESVKVALDEIKDLANKLLKVLDQDADGQISLQEVASQSSDNMLVAGDIIKQVQQIQFALGDKYAYNDEGGAYGGGTEEEGEDDGDVFGSSIALDEEGQLDDGGVFGSSIALDEEGEDDGDGDVLWSSIALGEEGEDDGDVLASSIGLDEEGQPEEDLIGEFDEFDEFGEYHDEL
ncbi:uncharacterized protein LOC126809970 [Patella vulgata]|uniref:uncharacterized protein LOC126809970 n=1 Tax=Patella vulgata TaxID=6465 RepID=UPI002180287E|nr:uncharacterized protein LOC126809970 [Patella vulgata]